MKENSWLPTLDDEEPLNIDTAMLDRRFVFLSRAVDEVFDGVKKAESDYQNLTTLYELKVAESRIRLAGEKNPDTDKTWTAQDREDLALIEAKDLFDQMNVAEAIVKAARSNIKRIELLVGLTQSLGRNYQSSMNISGKQ